jgi:hypothetical protein
MKDAGVFPCSTCVPDKRADSGPALSHPLSVAASAPQLSFDRAKERMKQLTPTERLRLEKLLAQTRAESKRATRKPAAANTFATEGSA